jgi:hypothetical protein
VRLGAVAAAGFTVIAAATALPTGERAADAPATPAQGTRAAAQQPALPQPVELTAAERAGIDALLARFVPWAIARERPMAAYRLVTPGLRAAATPAEWRRGNLPVMPYPADLRRSRAWTLNYAFPNRANLDLLLLPRPGVRRGALAMNLELVERRGRWLVDAVIPAAVFSPPGEAPRITAQPDLAPQPPEAADRGRLNPAWLLLFPAALLLTPLVAVGVHSLRPRRR